jgi:Ca-activated chloride channel homolog
MKNAAAVRKPEAGLLAGPNARPLPLEGVKVHAEILGHASRVTMAQRFRNTEDVPIEAVYVFPVPEAAAVCGLAMRIGERRIEGVVEERERAFEIYDEAMAAGHGAVLLDSERPNVFTASVGNILPKQEVVVELKWAAELRMEGEAIRFMLPTTVAPRYAPNEDLRGVSPTPAERVSPPVELDVPYGLELEVDVTLPCPVRTVDSPSHPVRFELDGARARVTLSHGAAARDRDFVLLITPQEAGAPQVLVERNADGLATAAVSFVPRLEAGTCRNEVVFLVDRSGSMGGSSIEQVRAALHLCLRGLREGDRFNIVGFGSDFLPLFTDSRPYDQDSLEKASAWVDALDADMGGTEILPALRSVLQREPAAGLSRQVVLLTDGEVTNEAAVVELAERHRSHTRIFTFGIGYGASEHLIRSLARVTRGEAEFIHPGERIEPKVLRQFARLGTPALREVKVEWQGAAVKLQAPHRPPAIFNGEPAVLYARLEAQGAATVILSGTAEGKPVSWTLPVDAGAAAPGDLLATLAARVAIRDLEEGTSALHEEKRGSAQRGRREERVKKEIVALATAYRLASSETSFVAIEHREGAEDHPAAELRRVPVALTHGWGGVEGQAQFLRPHMVGQPLALASLPVHDSGGLDAPSQADLGPSLARRTPVSRGLLRWARASAGARDQHQEPEPQFRERRQSMPGGFEPPVSGTPSAPERPHLAVARLQRADGSWTLGAKLAHALGVSLAALRDTAASLGGGDLEDLVATLAALRFLRTHAAAFEDEWRPLAAKAEAWLVTALAARPSHPGPDDRAHLEALLASLLSA